MLKVKRKNGLSKIWGKYYSAAAYRLAFELESRTLNTAKQYLQNTIINISTLFKMAVIESDKIQDAKKISSTDPNKAIQLYKDIITNNTKAAVINDTQSREFEAALLSLGELYRDQK